jgi:hypothetical protein
MVEEWSRRRLLKITSSSAFGGGVGTWLSAGPTTSSERTPSEDCHGTPTATTVDQDTVQADSTSTPAETTPRSASITLEPTRDVVTAQAGDTIRVSFILTNQTDTAVTDIEVNIDVYSLSDIELTDAQSVPDGEWRVFESLTLWSPTHPIAPGESVRVVAPLSVAESAQGVYQLDAWLPYTGGADTRTAVRIEVPPISTDQSIRFTVRAGAFQKVSPFSLERAVVDRSLCPDDSAALGYTIRVVGGQPSQNTTIEINLPDGWGVAELRASGKWDAATSPVSLGTVDAGEEITVLVVLHPAVDGPEAGEYEVRQRLVNRCGVVAVRTTQFRVSSENTCA